MQFGLANDLPAVVAALGLGCKRSGRVPKFLGGNAFRRRERALRPSRVAAPASAAPPCRQLATASMDVCWSTPSSLSCTARFPSRARFALQTGYLAFATRLQFAPAGIAVGRPDKVAIIFKDFDFVSNTCARSVSVMAELPTSRASALESPLQAQHKSVAAEASCAARKISFLSSFSALIQEPTYAA